MFMAVEFSKVDGTYRVAYPYTLLTPEGGIAERMDSEFLPFVRDFAEDINYFPDEPVTTTFEPGYSPLEHEILLNIIALHHKIVKTSQWKPELLAQMVASKE